MNIPETLREIADKLSTSLNNDPDFIDIKDIKQGMILESWFCTEYEPTMGNYKKCDTPVEIIKVDGDMIFHSFLNQSTVQIRKRAFFDTCTLLPVTPAS